MKAFSGRLRCEILLIQTHHVWPTMIFRGGPAENLIKPCVFEGAPLEPERIRLTQEVPLSRIPQNLTN